MSLLSARPVVPSEHIVARRLGASTIVVNLITNDILELNETGSRIWELIAEACAARQISERIAAEYQIEPSDADRVVSGYLEQLATRGILRLES